MFCCGLTQREIPAFGLKTKAVISDFHVTLTVHVPVSTAEKSKIFEKQNVDEVIYNAQT